MTTGAQAECYANHYIGLHLSGIAGGKTYAQLGTDQFALQAKVAAAQKNNDPNLAALQKQYSDLVANHRSYIAGNFDGSSSGTSIAVDSSGNALIT